MIVGDRELSNSGLRRPVDEPAYRALCDGDREAFARAVSATAVVDLSYCDLGGVDLRFADVGRIRLEGARLKGADLRGLDLSQHNLDGVTLFNARVSGTYFPRDLSADEVRLSLREGTRIRHDEVRLSLREGTRIRHAKN